MIEIRSSTKNYPALSGAVATGVSRAAAPQNTGLTSPIGNAIVFWRAAGFSVPGRLIGFASIRLRRHGQQNCCYSVCEASEPSRLHLVGKATPVVDVRKGRVGCFSPSERLAPYPAAADLRKLLGRPYSEPTLLKLTYAYE